MEVRTVSIILVTAGAVNAAVQSVDVIVATAETVPAVSPIAVGAVPVAETVPLLIFKNAPAIGKYEHLQHNLERPRTRTMSGVLQHLLGGK